MNQFIVRHNETKEYIYPTSRNSVVIKLECLVDKELIINLVYWKRFNQNKSKKVTLKNFNFSGFSHFYQVELDFSESVRYLNYYFEIIDQDEVFYYTPYGISQENTNRFFEYQSTNENDIFKTPSWAKGITGYHIFPDRFHRGNVHLDRKNIEDWDNKPSRINFFGGDIRGIINKIDYLKTFGIDAIFLTPIFTSSSNHKYDTIDYFEIDPAFGSIEDLKELVSKAHQVNIKIVLDGVFNHIGFYSKQFQDVIEKGKNSPYWNWFYIKGDTVDVENMNFECVGDYKLMPKLRYSSKELRLYILNVGTYWIKEANIDGWRLDVADEIDYTFWQEFRKSIKSVKPDALLIGETWHDARDLIRGDQLDSIMNYRFREYVLDYFIRQKLDKESFKFKIEELMFQYPVQTKDILYNLLGSHDTPRLLTIANHEIDLLKMVVAFQMTYPGMPIIYYGDEIGIEGNTDPDCRATMKWEKQNKEIFSFYQQMIQMRSTQKGLKYGDFKHFDIEDDVYGFVRTFEDESIVVLFNNGTQGKNVNFDISIFNQQVVDAGKGYKVKFHISENTFRIIKVIEKDNEMKFEILA
ncbi:MAG: glycoside hydrolase family 13 protein [Firmicutes bacterium]|nr:glycoside hydrolase family 13 protein [Bacillota bacterium]